MSKNTNEKIAILVLSFDGFEELWKPFFDFFFNTWHDCPYKVYLLNNLKSYNDERVNNLLVGKDISWSDSLILGLKKIKEERILFFYDDTLLTNISHDIVDTAINFAINNSVDSIVMRPNIFQNKDKKHNNIFKIYPNALYRNSLFLNLIKKDVLLEILKPNESAWDFEILGNARSYDLNCYSVSKLGFEYHHCIVKGMWYPSILKKLKNSGYSFKNSKVMPWHKVAINYVKSNLMLIYYNTVPMSLVLKLEKYRKNHS